MQKKVWIFCAQTQKSTLFLKTRDKNKAVKFCASRTQCHACMSNAEAQPRLSKSVKSAKSA
jgi:hypothetical protein